MSSKTNMSLAKLSKDLFKEYIKESTIDKPFFNKLIDDIEGRIPSDVKFHKEMKEGNIYVLVYETRTDINWKGFIVSNFNTELPLTTLTNSYLLLFNIDNDVYAITAGRANNIIDSYKDKTFGLRIMTKLFNEDDPVIKKNVESYVNEPKTSGSSTYRGSNSFFDETIVTSIKRNMDIETNPYILEKMGIIEREKDGSLDDKVLSIKFGNNIETSKRLSFSEMKRAVNKIHNIDKNKEVLFALDNISLAEKYNIKQSDIKGELLIKLKLDEYLNDLYIPYNGNYNIENMYLYNGLKRINENKFNDIKTYGDLTNYVKDKLKSSVSFLDYYLIDETESDIKVKLYDLLEISIVYKEREFFLIGGSFYTFDNNYLEFYNNRYEDFFNISNTFIQSSPLMNTKYKDIKDYNNESLFNETLKNEPNFIYADMKRYKEVELADAFYITDNDEIILIHNKSKFNGQGVRDVIGQIETSSKYLKEIINLPETEREPWDNYLKRLKENNVHKDRLINKLDKVLKSNNYKIIYIASFIDEININTGSTYIKFLIDQCRKLLEGYEFYIY